MEAFLLYLGKVALAMGAFYLVFLVLFQKQKQFRFNRIYLLASMGISYLIPLITLTFTKQVEASPMPVFTDYNFAETAPVNVSIEKVFEWYDYLFIILMAGVAGFAINFLVGNLKALNIIRKSYKKEDLGSAVRITTEDVHPFSFFNKVIVSTRVLSHPNLPLILAHETLHIKEKHTFDILISELLFLFQWFNPFAWLMKDAVKTNLEFITDDYVTKFNDRETYQLAMVSLADKKGIAPFLNALNGSQLKNRIIMMKKKTTNRFAVVKQLAIIPVLTLLIIGLSNKEFRAEVIKSPEKAQTEKPAEKKVVKGKVTDENGNPLAGVIIDGKSQGKILNSNTSDKDGNYSIEAKSEPMSVTFSMPGFYKTSVSFQDFSRGSEEYNIKLLSNGSQNPSEITVPGSGDKNSRQDSILKIRNNQGTAKPLYILDGKPVDNIESINPETIESINVLKEESATKLYGEKGKNGVVLITSKKNPKTGPKEEAPFVNVEQMPQFPGGEKALSKWMEQKIQITEKEKKMDIEGTVYIRFVVDKEGKVVKVEVQRGTQTILDNVAVYIISSMPDWIPGKQGGKAVPVSYTIPVRFGNPATKGLSTLGDGLFLIVDGKEFYTDIDLRSADNEKISSILGISVNDIKSIEVLKDASSITPYGEKGKNGVIIITTKTNSKTGLKEAAPFSMVEQMPEFPGGEKGLKEYLAQNIHYPSEVKKDSMGIVFVRFTVTKDGKIENAKIAKKDQPALETEALRLINSMPDWKPGIQSGKAVDVSYTIPVQFGNKKTTGSGDKPLIILDGKEVENMPELDKISLEKIDILKDKSATKLYGEKGKNGVVLITTKKNPKPELKEEAPFVMVEQMPEFPGGENGLKEYFAQNMQFPSEVKKDSLGTVLVRFVVTKDGKIENAKIAKKDHPALEAEALRLINSMPDWKPGIQSGKAVDVSYTLPVKFGNKKPTGSGNRFLWIVDGKEVDYDNFDKSTIKSSLVLNDEASIKPYGEKAKNGVVFASTRDNPSINSEKELIQFLAQQIRYPEAAREKNVKGEVKLFVKYDETGRMRSINDEPVKDFIVFRDVIITRYKEKDYKPTEQEQEVLFTLLKNEAYRTIGTINQINVAEMKGKTVQFTFKFIVK